uniref:Slit n=1 Tax=Panagrolaimus sp. ES5 TaxID=591445 RepID=A0AC34FEV5_9BILA
MRNLQLDKNRLTCIETEVIREWKTLEIFTINGNRLTTLDTIDALPNLRIFRLNDNPLLCDCRMKWVRNVINASLISKVKCHRPMLLQGHNLIQVEEDDMKCSGIEKRAAVSCADKKRCPSECACTATIVDCHDRSLSHIPSNLPIGIEEIRLNGNKITTIPSKAFEKLHKLRTLDLSRNQINEIAADAFSDLNKLQHLHLFHNNISELAPQTFFGLKELEMLMLNANNLRCIPKELFKDLDELNVLSIYKNKIKSIENGTFDSLKSVRALHLSENPYICDCNLAWLAEFLGKKQLLDTSGVKCAAPKRMIGIHFATADPEKFKCKGAEYLVTKSAGQCLIDNPCPMQCSCFGTVVDCSNRDLETIPEKLPRFTTTLLINKNKITEILADNGLQKLPSLEKIDLSNNNITVVEYNAFHGLKNLKELVLNNNQLTRFLYSFLGDSAHSIERLHLNSNHLECISSDTFGKMRNLTLLSIADNNIKSIAKETLENLPKLNSIYLSGNKFICTCDITGIVDYLKTNTVTKLLDVPICSSPENFQGMELLKFEGTSQNCVYNTSRSLCTQQGSYCPIGCICEGTIVRCSRSGINIFPNTLPLETTELYLNGNNISEIDKASLNRLTNLVRLDLSNNELTVIENEIFQQLNKLDVLILNFNKIQCLEEYAFSGLNSVRILSLHGNNLSQISHKTFSNLTRTIQQIAMLNNPFYCDCNLAWFNQWISQSYVESGLSKCAGPPRVADQLILTANPSQFTCTEPLPKDILSKCNPCVNSPCKHGGTCVRGVKRSYECRCAVGYYGKNCENEIDACYGVPCENNGRCDVIEEGRFKCTCSKGFIGSHCETNIDDCMGHKCKNGATCVDGINNYKCLCPPLFAGKYCEEKIHYCNEGFNPCKNNGKCEPIGTLLYKCHCLQGYSGQNCTIKTDNCLPDSCHNNGVCESNDHGFTCGICKKNDEDEIECQCHFGFDVNDGKFHFIRLEIAGNQATLLIDNVFPQTIANKGRTKRMELKTKQPVYFGGLPQKVAATAISDFRIKNSQSLSGCISNVYFNEMMVDFADTSLVEKHNTIVGCGRTIDLCENIDCNNAGKCIQNTSYTDGYQCKCNISFTGKDCEERKPSCTKEKFRRYHEENGCRSVDLIKNAKCLGWCGSDSTFPVTNPDGSMLGPNCCCRAVKTRQRKIKMICPNGSKRYSIVQIIRKCQCTSCTRPSFY